MDEPAVLLEAIKVRHKVEAVRPGVMDVFRLLKCPDRRLQDPLRRDIYRQDQHREEVVAVPLSTANLCQCLEGQSTIQHIWIGHEVAMV